MTPISITLLLNYSYSIGIPKKCSQFLICSDTKSNLGPKIILCILLMIIFYYYFLIRSWSGSTTFDLRSKQKSKKKLNIGNRCECVNNNSKKYQEKII